MSSQDFNRYRFDGYSAAELLDRALAGVADPEAFLTELALNAISNALALTYDVWDVQVANSTAAMNGNVRAMRLVEFVEENAKPKAKRKNPYAVQERSPAPEVRGDGEAGEDDSEDVRRVERRNAPKPARSGKKVPSKTYKKRVGRPAKSESPEVESEE